MRGNKLINGIVVILGLALMLSVQAEAQNFGHGFGSGPKDKRGGPPGFGFRERNFENLMLLKLLEAIDLNEDQSDQFILAFSQFRKEMRKKAEAADAEVDKLIELLKAEKLDEKLVQESVDKIFKMRQERMKDMDSLHKKVSSILTVEQLGKMTVFMERFERNLLETIQGFRGRDETETSNPTSEDGK